MTRINRRRFTKLSGASALAAGTGGLAGILASGKAPAYAQTATVHWLRWADFIPASDVLLKGPIVQQCQKDLGIKLTVETINANDIQARITSGIQSGSGPDIIMGLNNWPQLYGASLADVSDLAEKLGSAGGGYYDVHKMQNMRHELTILAYEMNGAPLSVLHGAPLRLRDENELGFKMVKWIAAIEFVRDFANLGAGQGGYNEDHEFYGYRTPI